MAPLLRSGQLFRFAIDPVPGGVRTCHAAEDRSLTRCRSAVQARDSVGRRLEKLTDLSCQKGQAFDGFSESPGPSSYLDAGWGVAFNRN